MPDPIAQLGLWFAEAGPASPMTLATAGPDGAHARTVLVTGVVDGAVRFHSSTPTGKTRDLAADPRASGVFLWPALGRQVVLTGRAAELDPAVSRAAFPTRPRALQLLAWVYETVPTAPDGSVPDGAVEAAFAAAAADPGSVHAPPSWTTLALTPSVLEFWTTGTDTTPARRTRWTRGPAGWTATTVRP